MLDKIPVDWVVAFVTGAVSYVSARFWNRATTNQKAIMTAALGEARSIIRTLVITARPDATPEQIGIWCKGAIAVQLAKRKVNVKDPLVEALTAELVADGITLFVDLHPNRQSLITPMGVKLGL